MSSITSVIGPFGSGPGGGGGGGGGNPNALYSALDMDDIPFHNGSGAWGAQLAFQTATPPTITSDVNVTTVAELQTACSTPGTRATLTADITGGNVTGDMTDIEIVVPNGRILNGTVFGTYNGSTVLTRMRFTKASGDSGIGGQMHMIQLYGATARDIIVDGLQLSATLGGQGLPFFFDGQFLDTERVAILRNRIKSDSATYGYGVPHLLIAGNSAYHDANNADNSGDWGYRISSAGPAIFFENDTRGNNYSPLRFHPRDGSALQYAWCSGNTFVNNDTVSGSARTFDCNDTGGSSSYPENIDAVWMLNSTFYLESAGFSQGNTRSSPASGPTVDYFRINGCTVNGDLGPFTDGGASDGDVTGNTYNAALGTVPAWGAAGDPTGIDTTP